MAKKKLTEQQAVDLKRAEVALDKIEARMNNPVYEPSLPSLIKQKEKWEGVKARIVGDTDTTKPKKAGGKPGGKKKSARKKSRSKEE